MISALFLGERRLRPCLDYGKQNLTKTGDPGPAGLRIYFQIFRERDQAVSANCDSRPARNFEVSYFEEVERLTQRLLAWPAALGKHQSPLVGGTPK
jgi:hypothetical protein